MAVLLSAVPVSSLCILLTFICHVCASSVPTELKKRIQAARLEKKLTQAQLGQLINEKPNVSPATLPAPPPSSLAQIPSMQSLRDLLVSC